MLNEDPQTVEEILQENMQIDNTIFCIEDMLLISFYGLFFLFTQFSPLFSSLLLSINICLTILHYRPFSPWPLILLLLCEFVNLFTSIKNYRSLDSCLSIAFSFLFHRLLSFPNSHLFPFFSMVFLDVLESRVPQFISGRLNLSQCGSILFFPGCFSACL